ncbi:hypothetical protein PMAYCL1PPCAC_32227, partial [Pristionchus mayeri]
PQSIFFPFLSRSARFLHESFCTLPQHKYFFFVVENLHRYPSGHEPVEQWTGRPLLRREAIPTGHASRDSGNRAQQTLLVSAGLRMQLYSAGQGFRSLQGRIVDEDS